jgi:hypothetical protein
MGAGSSPSGSLQCPSRSQQPKYCEGRRVDGALRALTNLSGVRLGVSPTYIVGFSPSDVSRLDRAVTLSVMCRNIRTLHNFEPPASEEEIRAAALQYVRKISGFTKPSRANEEAFAAAIDEVAAASATLLAQLTTNAPPKNREVEAAKARARAAERYAA